MFVDLKTNGPKTWPFVLKALEPLRAKGYLSHVVDGRYIERPVTVIGTGLAPFRDIKANENRDAFFDGPLKDVSADDVTALISPIASTSFKRQFGRIRDGEKFRNSTQIEKLKKQVEAAHAKGILARYWDLPKYPISLRNHIWQILTDEDVDLLNVDDLKDAAGFWTLNNQA